MCRSLTQFTVNEVIRRVIASGVIIASLFALILSSYMILCVLRYFLSNMKSVYWNMNKDKIGGKLIRKWMITIRWWKNNNNNDNDNVDTNVYESPSFVSFQLTYEWSFEGASFRVLIEFRMKTTKLSLWP